MLKLLQYGVNDGYGKLIANLGTIPLVYAAICITDYFIGSKDTFLDIYSYSFFMQMMILIIVSLGIEGGSVDRNKQMILCLPKRGWEFSGAVLLNSLLKVGVAGICSSIAFYIHLSITKHPQRIIQDIIENANFPVGAIFSGMLMIFAAVFIVSWFSWVLVHSFEIKHKKLCGFFITIAIIIVTQGIGGVIALLLPLRVLVPNTVLYIFPLLKEANYRLPINLTGILIPMLAYIVCLGWSARWIDTKIDI